MSFVENVLAYLQGGDESKVLKFQNGVEKYLNRQIKEIEDQSEEFVDKLEEAKDELKEASLNVDVSKIQTTDDRKVYIEQYIDLLESKEQKIINLEKKIKENNLLIDLRKRQLKLLK